MARSARKGQEQEININLMPQQEVKGTLGTTINWILGVGRYLIITAQIIALVAFGLSLKLTIDRNNLTTSIKSSQSVIDSKSEFEQEFREVQGKLQNIKELRAKQFKNHLVIQEFNNLLPKGINLTNLNIDDNTLSFAGSFPTAAQLHTMINSFNSSTKIVALDITELNTPSEEEPKFTFNAEAAIVTSPFTGAGIKPQEKKQNNSLNEDGQEGNQP